MHTGWREVVASAFAAVALMGLAAGCDDKKDKAQGPADAGAVDAGPPQPVVGGKLGEALAEAAANVAEQAPAGGAPDGPPEDGVFSPSAAAAALPRDTPYKIEVISDGAEPRIQLAAKLDPKAEQKLNVTLGLRGGGPQAPPLDLGMSLKAEKPKEGAQKPGEGAAAPSAPAVTITATLQSATLASLSLAGPPKQIADELAKLRGSSVRYELSPANVASNFKVNVAKGADPGTASLLAALGEALGALTPPLPDKPVGLGAYWMVTDRVVASGVELPVVRYRVFKIEKMEGDLVSFSVMTRQYAEGADMKLPGPKGDVTLTIDRFESSGKGALTWSASTFAPAAGDLSQRLQALLVPPGGQRTAPRSVVEVELTAKLAPPAAP